MTEMLLELPKFNIFVDTIASLKLSTLPMKPDTWQTYQSYKRKTEVESIVNF